MAIITNNTLFCKAVDVLKELGSLSEAEFTKKDFEERAYERFRGYTSPSTIFENLRDMGLVTLVRKEDLSIVMDNWGDEQNITMAEYNALPQCVQDALDWNISVRVRHWYKVNHLAMVQEIASRKEQLSKDFRMLDLL